MNMRLFFAICLVAIGLSAYAQADSILLKETMSKLDKAIIEKDYAALQSVLNDNVSYGHSNAWIENKQDIINDLKSGKLTYDKIENNSITIAAISKDWATVRINTSAEGTANGSAFQMKLHIMQVWIKTKGGWQLLARQSTKL